MSSDDRDDPDDDDQSSTSPTSTVSHTAASPSSPPPSPPPPPPIPTNSTTTSVTKLAASLARKRDAWLLGLQKMITPRRRNSVEYSKVGDDDDDDDNDDLHRHHPQNVEMTGIILTDVNLNDDDDDNNNTIIPTEDNNEEEVMIGISVALDLPPPWELGRSSALRHNPTNSNHSHSSHSSHSHSSSTGTINVADALQIIPTLLLASFALAATGAVLDSAQHWFVFEKRSTYFAVMPMVRVFLIYCFWLP